MKPAAATAMSVAPLRIAPEVATGRPVAVVVVIVCPPSDGCGSPAQETDASDGLALAGTGSRSSESTVGVNQWPRSQPVLTCSTGPPVDSKFQRSTILAGAPQAGSGQAMTSAGVRWKVGSVVSGMAASCQSVDRPRYE